MIMDGCDPAESVWSARATDCGFRKQRRMAIRQLTGCCLMASCLLLSTSTAASTAAAAVASDPGAPPRPGKQQR